MDVLFGASKSEKKVTFHSHYKA